MANHTEMGRQSHCCPPLPTAARQHSAGVCLRPRPTAAHHPLRGWGVGRGQQTCHDHPPINHPTAARAAVTP